jgi:tetratricopeptide (TPR) repeat protein
VTIVGRLRELELLSRVVAAAEAGAGGVALVEGDAGIGKTSLIEALASRTAGAAVVRGRAWEEGGAPPAWPWREVAAALNASVDWDGALDRFTVYQRVVAALRIAAAPRPLVVLLDDLHAADDETLALTRLVCRSIREAPVAVVIGARPSERLSALARESVRVSLGPMSLGEIAAVADQYAAAPLSRRAHERIASLAEGNPLVARELALGGHDPATGGELPGQLRDLVTDRVRGLADPVRQLLEVASVLGRQFDMTDLATFVDRPIEELVDLLEEAADARVVASLSGTQWQFSHQLVRDGVYESISAWTRLELHAIVARHLGASGPDDRLDEQARHLIAAVPLVDRDDAIGTAVRAADRAAKSGAFAAAADTLLAAVAIADTDRTRLRVLLELGDALLRAGRVGEAWGSFDQACRLATAAGDRKAYTRALLGRTERVPSTSDASELAGLVEQTLAHAPEGSVERIRLLTRCAGLQAAAGAAASAGAAAMDAVTAARATGDVGLLLDALTVRHLTLRGPDDAEAAGEVSDELVARADSSESPERVLDAAMAQLVDQLRLGDIAGVDRTLDRYRRVAGASGRPRDRFFADSRRAMRAFLAGRLAEGEALIDRARRIGTDIEEPDAESVYRGARVMVLADLVDSSQVLAEAEHAEHVAAITGETRLLIFAAYLRAAADDYRAAAELLDRAITPDFTNIARDGSWLMFMCMAAYVIAHSREAHRAEVIYNLLQPHCGRIVVNAGAVTFGGVVDHYIGILAGELGDTDTAITHLDEAINTYERLGAQLFLARARASRNELLGPLPSELVPARHQARLCRSGSQWECGFSGAAFHIPHMIGLQHLARLVAANGNEVHVLELTSSGAAQMAGAPSAQALLDPKAKEAYRQRIADLRDDLDEAEDNNDFERADRLRAELDTIVDELRSAVGLGGRDRTAANNAERARVAVRKAITAAIDRVAEHDSAFAQHLRLHVQTGLYCRYEPDPTEPIDWETSV